MKQRIILITLGGMILIALAYLVAFAPDITEPEGAVPWYLIARRRMVGKSMISPKQCIAEVTGLKLSYPSVWGDCDVKKDQISFRTSFSKYQIDAVASVKQDDKADIANFMTKKTGTEYMDIMGGQAFKFKCDNAIACNGVILGDNVYTFKWNVVSNQVKPATATADWKPEHNVVEADTWNIVKTASVYAVAKVDAMKTPANK